MLHLKESDFNEFCISHSGRIVVSFSPEGVCLYHVSQGISSICTFLGTAKGKTKYFKSLNSLNTFFAKYPFFEREAVVHIASYGGQYSTN
jgi:hypothetical protein